MIDRSLRALASVLFVAASGSCGDSPLPTDGQVEGTQLGLALSQHIVKSLVWTAPYRCARFAEKPAALHMSGVSWQEEQGSLEFETKAKSPRLATIADIRADADIELGGLHALRDALNEEKIDLLVTLGGLGTDAAALGRALGALTESANYVVLALPGDRESIRAHRETVANLAVKGARILDGSRYRVAQLGGLRLVSMPGIAKAANLIAGDDGCLHTAADVEALRERLGTLGAPALLLAYAPWRQRDTVASDYGIGAIHTGERLLASLQSNPHVVGLVHGMLGSAPGQTEGTLRLGTPAPAISAGSLDPLDEAPSALLLTGSGPRLSWKRLPVHWTK